MIYYLDASALVKVYCYEEGTETVVNLLNAKLPLCSSMVIYSEVLFALRRKMENKEINQDNFLEQVGRFKSHFQALINSVQLNESIFDLLDNRVLKYSIRALDAIHLASALWIRENIDEKCIFICSDENLLKIAREESFDIINPQEMSKNTGGSV